MEGSRIRNRYPRRNGANPRPTEDPIVEEVTTHAQMTGNLIKTHFQPDSNLLTKFEIKGEEFAVLNSLMLKEALEALINEVDDHQINSEEIPIGLQIRFCRFKSLICEYNRAEAQRWVEQNGIELNKYSLDTRLDREELLVCALRVEHRLLMELYKCGDNPTRRQGIIDNLQRYRQQVRNSGQPWGRCPTLVEAQYDLQPRRTSSTVPVDAEAVEERGWVVPPNGRLVLCQGRTHRRYYRVSGQCRRCEEEHGAQWESVRGRLLQADEDMSSRVARRLARIS